MSTALTTFDSMRNKKALLSQTNPATQYVIYSIHIFHLEFLPRDATQSAVLLWQVVCPSDCPSVCLSVTLRYCDYIGWKSSKIISWLVSLGCSLFATPTSQGNSKGNTLKFGLKVAHAPDDLSVGDNRSQYLQNYSS